MQFTLALPLCPADHLIPLAQAAEASGWDAVSMPDSVFFPEEVSAPYPYSGDGGRFWAPTDPWVEPLVAIPAMAAATTRLRFFTNVYKTGIRHPLLVAKTVGSVAVMSGNRFGLGVGLSWIPEEFAWLGQEMKTRGRRLDEAIAIIRLALQPDFVAFEGEHYQFGRLQMSPAPTLPVPIYVGGHSAPALRRAARLGDGWIAVQVTEEDVAEILPKLRAALAEEGRADVPFEVKVTPMVLPEVDAMRRLGALGVTDVIYVPWYFYPGDHQQLDVKLDAVKRFADEVIHPMSEEDRP